MSITAIERAYALDISPTEQRVLLVIAKHCDENGHNGYPSVGLIAWMLGLKDRQVQRTLHGLVEQKILAVVQAGGGRGRTTHYFFDLNAGTVKTPFKPEYLRRNDVTDSTPFNGNGVIASTPFTDNRAVMTGLSVETVSQPVHPLAETVSSDELKGVLPELKGVISDVKGVIAMTPESTLKIIKDHHQKDARAPAPALRLIPGGRGGGGGEMNDRDDVEIDDVGETCPEEIDVDEAEVARLKSDLVDALIALSVRPEMAFKAVHAGTVTSDRDVVLCKRFILSSTAHTPAAVLWLQYLSLGKLPPAPYSDQSTLTLSQRETARQMREETERRHEQGGGMIDQAALAALKARQSRPVLKPMPATASAESYWNTQ